MADQKKIAVITGGTGLLGANVAVILLQQGVHVRCIKRKNSNTKNLDDHKEIEWVLGDLSEVASLVEAFKGADVVFHCAASLATHERHPTPELIKTNVEGTQHVIDAVKQSSVGRLVYCSSSVAVGISETDEPATEDIEWNLPKYSLDDGYSITKHDAEKLVIAAAKSGEIDAVVVNPTKMLGPFINVNNSAKMIADIAKGEIPGIPAGVMNFVDVRDVASGMISAWHKGRNGERYILSGHNFFYKDFIPLVAKLAGVHAPTWEIPKPIAMTMGWIGEVKQKITGHQQDMSISRMRWVYNTHFKFSCQKAEKELGYHVSPIEPAIVISLEWFKKEGVVEHKDASKEEHKQDKEHSEHPKEFKEYGTGP